MLPFFFQQGDFQINDTVVLDKINSNYTIAVLRMKLDDELIIVNGNGYKYLGSIILANKNKCSVKILKSSFLEARKTKLALAIGFTKNKSRNEWLLEKITEIGVDYIIPLQCEHSERIALKKDRIQQILVAAMLQSQQLYLPQFLPITKVEELIQDKRFDDYQKVIAHCEEGTKDSLSSVLEKDKNTLIFIGPEGDFSPSEISSLLSNEVKPISLGSNRLRTETAGMYVCTVFNQLNYAI